MFWQFDLNLKPKLKQFCRNSLFWGTIWSKFMTKMSTIMPKNGNILPDISYYFWFLMQKCSFMSLFWLKTSQKTFKRLILDENQKLSSFLGLKRIILDVKLLWLFSLSSQILTFASYFSAPVQNYLIICDVLGQFQPRNAIKPPLEVYV